jgi:hypothetical protein
LLPISEISTADRGGAFDKYQLDNNEDQFEISPKSNSMTKSVNRQDLKENKLFLTELKAAHPVHCFGCH